MYDHVIWPEQFHPKISAIYALLMFIAAKGTHEGKPSAYVDLYRVQDEKIVEHWGFPQMVPPPSESKNDNGML